MNNFEDFMRAVSGENREPEPLDPEVVIMRLREAQERYTRKNPFKVGDFVMFVKDGMYRDAGQPRLVVAVNPEAKPDFNVGNAGECYFGAVFDIRTIGMARDSLVPLWTESSQCEFYPTPKSN